MWRRGWQSSPPLPALNTEVMPEGDTALMGPGSSDIQGAEGVTKTWDFTSLSCWVSGDHHILSASCELLFGRNSLIEETVFYSDLKPYKEIAGVI